jgi:hypothetical protein
VTASSRDADAFLRDLEALECDPESSALEVAEHGILQFAEALEPVAPPSGARGALLASITTQGRFARFAEQTAKMLDLGLDQAKALLDRLHDLSLFESELPGIQFYWCEGGPAVANAVRGFVRVAAGTNFPEHEHIGDEIVLVLQGTFVDTTRGLTFHAGDSDIMRAGTSHSYYVPAGGPDLLKLSVTQVGLRAMGHTYSPRK